MRETNFSPEGGARKDTKIVKNRIFNLERN